MTALIYKAALPTYTSLADLNANAGESLLLNDAGTAYELEPAQSGASEPCWFMAFGTGVTPVPSDDFKMPLTVGDDPAPIGTGVSWAAGSPTKLHIEEAGSYSVLAQATFQRGSADCGPHISVTYNDDDAGPYYQVGALGKLSVATPQSILILTWPPFPMSVGDTIEVDIYGSGIAAAGAVLVGGTLVVSRA